MLEVTFVVVKHAVEATIAMEVLEGELHGMKVTASTTAVKGSRLVLYDSELAGRRLVQMLRPAVAVYVKEKLEVTVAAARTDCAAEVESTVSFTPRASGEDEGEVTCGSVKMRVKVSWSVFSHLPMR